MKIKLYMVIIVFNFFIGCSDNITDPKDTAKAIYGKVTDVNGTPLNGIGIHYIFYVGMNQFFNNAVINYQVATAQYVTVKVYDAFNKVVSVLMDNKFHAAGGWAISFRGANFTNGVYRYEVLGENFSIGGSFLLLDNSISKLSSISPLITSDSKGNFKLDYSALEIGKTFYYQLLTDSVNITIQDSIKLVFIGAGFQTLVEPLKIDTNVSINKTFVLNSN